MRNSISVVIILVIFGGLCFFAGKSCNSNQNTTSIDKTLAEIDKSLIEIKKDRKQIDSALKALRVEKNETKNYYTNKYYEIDSLANLDSLILYAIIRSRTNRLYQLPGFFSFTIRDTGIGNDSKNSSGW